MATGLIRMIECFATPLLAIILIIYLMRFLAGSDYGINGKSKYFTGWMLLNYNKPVQVSSTLGGYMLIML
jgi:hypothetical protein